MKDLTTFRNINGTWYLRVPPGFARHLDLENNGEIVDGEIQDETNSKGQHYCSFWVKGQ